MKSSPHRWVFAALCGATLVGVGYLLYSGGSFYLAPLVERPRHPDYWALKPGGTRGHVFGIAGIALMVVMHVYSLRRRWRPLRDVGPLSAWLTFHIYCGLLGPALIVLHSSFKVRGLVALSFWSMVAVAASGVLGRYLYRQIPRRRSGEELTRAEIDELDRALTARLRDDFGLAPGDLARLEALGSSGLSADTSLTSLVCRLPFEGIALRLRLRRVARGLRVPGGPLLRELMEVSRQKVMIERRIAILDRLQRLFHYWHVFHKPFALVMYLFAAVHIAVAAATGYGW